MTTTLLAQLSDPHIQIGPDEQGAAERLEAAVRAVLELRPHPHAVLVTGDLTEHGRPADYERVLELLAPLPMPVHVLPRGCAWASLDGGLPVAGRAPCRRDRRSQTPRHARGL